MAVLVLVIVNLAGFRSNIVCNMCFGLLRIIDMSQIEAVLHRTLRQIVIVRSGQFLAVVTLVLLASMQQLVAVLVLLNDQVGNDLACLRVLRHGDERRLDQIAQTQRVRVHRHSDRDVLDRHGRHSAHAVDSVVECGIDRILHGLVDLGLRTASRFRLCNRNTVLAVFILGQDFLPVCRAVVVLIQTSQRCVELFKCHLAILGIRILRACPLGIDNQIRVRDHRAFPQGVASLVRVPAGEGISRLGRLRDGDGAPRGAGDRGHVGAAVGIESHGMAFGLQIERTVGAKVYRDTGSRGSDCSDGGGTSLTAGSAANVERVSGIQQRPRVFIITHDVGAGTAAAVYDHVNAAVTADGTIHDGDAVRADGCIGSDTVRRPDIAQHIGGDSRNGAVSGVRAAAVAAEHDEAVILRLQKQLLVRGHVKHAAVCSGCHARGERHQRPALAVIAIERAVSLHGVGDGVADLAEAVKLLRLAVFLPLRAVPMHILHPDVVRREYDGAVRRGIAL